MSRVSEASVEVVQEQVERQLPRSLDGLRRAMGRAVLAVGLTFSGAAIMAGDTVIDADPAAAVTDDYPDKDAYFCGSYPDRPYDWCKNGQLASPRGYDYRNCTDWAAWRIPQITGKAVPTGLGWAHMWDNNARGRYEVDNKPEVGDAAVWDSIHVAVVESVNADGSVNISEYNGAGDGKYRTRSGMRADHYIDFTPDINEGLQNRPESTTDKKAKRSDFNGNGNSDLLLYKSGGADYVWQGHDARGDFGVHRLYIGAGFDITVGDFNGNGRADFIAYAKGATQDYIFYGQEEPGEFKKLPIQIDGNYDQIIPGDFDADGYGDLVLYSPQGEDRIWYGTPHAANFDRQALNFQLSAGYQLTAGKYDNNNASDLFVYNPRGTDYLFSGQKSRGQYGFTRHTTNPQQDIAFARPISGDFNGDGRDDVMMHGPGSLPDYILYGLNNPGDFHRSNLSIAGNFTPLATGDYNGDGYDDAYLQSPAGNRNHLLSGTKNRGEFLVYVKSPGETYQPINT